MIVISSSSSGSVSSSSSRSNHSCSIASTIKISVRRRSIVWLDFHRRSRPGAFRCFLLCGIPGSRFVLENYGAKIKVRVGDRVRVGAKVDFVVVQGIFADWSHAAPDLARDFEGCLIVCALEGEFLAGANLVEDVSVLLLKPSDLLHQLVLVEIELEFRLDLVVKQSGVVVVRGSSLRGVVQEPLKELDLVLVGPQPLEQPPRVV